MRQPLFCAFGQETAAGSLPLYLNGTVTGAEPSPLIRDGGILTEKDETVQNMGDVKRKCKEKLQLAYCVQNAFNHWGL